MRPLIYLSLLLLFPIASEAHAQELYSCSVGQEISEFRGTSNYLHPVLVDSAYLPNQANNPAIASFVISEGASSSQTSVRLLSFTDNLGGPAGPQPQRSWSTIQLGFAPSVVKLAKMRVSGSYDVRMVVIAQNPNTKALHFQLLSPTGTLAGQAFTYNPPTTFVGGVSGGLISLTSQDNLGTLTAFGRTQYLSAPGSQQLNVGVQLCDQPTLSLSPAGSGIANILCRSRNGTISALPYFQTIGSWTHADARFRDKIEIEQDQFGNFGFAFVDYSGVLKFYRPASGLSIPIVADGLSLQNFSVGVSSFGSTSDQVLFYARSDGRFGEVPLYSTGIGAIQEKPTTWYTTVSNGLLSAQNVRTQLLDNDISSTSAAEAVMAFRAPLASATPSLQSLSGLFVKLPNDDSVGSILDLYSDQSETYATYGTISNASVAQIGADMSVIIYARRTTQQHVGTPLPMLLFFSICDRTV